MAARVAGFNEKRKGSTGEEEKPVLPFLAALSGCPFWGEGAAKGGVEKGRGSGGREVGSAAVSAVLPIFQPQAVCEHFLRQEGEEDVPALAP